MKRDDMDDEEGLVQDDDGDDCPIESDFDPDLDLGDDEFFDPDNGPDFYRDLDRPEIEDTLSEDEFPDEE